MLGLPEGSNPDFMFFFIAGKNHLNPTRKSIFLMGVGYSVGYGIFTQQKRGYALT
jgi:hypothetical protein